MQLKKKAQKIDSSIEKEGRKSRCFNWKRGQTKAYASIEKEDNATVEGNIMATEEHSATKTKGSGATEMERQLEKKAMICEVVF